MFNRILVLIAMLSCLNLFCIQNRKSSPLEWKALNVKYRSLSEIKAIVVNKHTSALYFPSLHHSPIAHLARWNDNGKKWENVFQRELLQSTMYPVISKLEPDSSLVLNLWTNGLLDSSEIPIKIEMADYAKRPVNGLYRLFTSYSYKQVVNILRGDSIQTFFSSEFEIKYER